MSDYESIFPAIERLSGGVATASDIDAIHEAIRSKKLTLRQSDEERGGVYITGNVYISGGDFVARDKIINLYLPPEAFKRLQSHRLSGVPDRVRVGKFVGREWEIREVTSQLEKQGAVIVWGIGQVGKSALMTEVARRRIDFYPGGVLWLACEETPTFDGLLTLVGNFCDRPQEIGNVKQSEVREGLSDLAECLLIWDGFEHVEHIELLNQFIQSLPQNCHWVVTSRRDPLSLDAPRLTLDPLPQNDSEELIHSILQDYEIPLPDAKLLNEVVRTCKGNPMALATLAMRARYRPIQAFKDELAAEYATNFLDTTLKDLVDNTVLIRLFIQLSVFPIAFSEEFAERLTKCPNLGKDLVELCRRGLMDYEAKLEVYRYHHEDIRVFAQEQLALRENPNKLRLRWANLLLQANEAPITIPTPLYQWHLYQGQSNDAGPIIITIIANALLGQEKHKVKTVAKSLDKPIWHGPFFIPQRIPNWATSPWGMANILREMNFDTHWGFRGNESLLISNMLRNRVTIAIIGERTPFLWAHPIIMYSYHPEKGYGIVDTARQQPEITWISRAKFLHQWRSFGWLYVEVGLKAAQ